MRSAPRFPLYFLIYCCPQEISDRLRLFREQTNEKVSLEGWQIGKTNSIRISEGHNSALIFATDSSIYICPRPTSKRKLGAVLV